MTKFLIAMTMAGFAYAIAQEWFPQYPTIHVWAAFLTYLFYSLLASPQKD
jgi:hypothetical protein